MSKLYVSCIVVALLALAMVPAMAANLGSDTVTVTATVPKYTDVIEEDTTIEFGTLADATNVGYVQSCQGPDAGPSSYLIDAVPTAFGTCKYIVETNTKLWSVVNSGSDLTAPLSDLPTYEMELQFSSTAAGTMSINDGANWYTVGDQSGYDCFWMDWTGCGDTKANAPEASGLTLADNGIGEFLIQAGQEFTVWTRAQLYQNGFNDPAGVYSQATLLTTTLWDSDPI